MKNLWTVLPPLMSDNFGFIEVLKGSDGCGIIDDSGGYRLGGGRGSHGGGRERREGREGKRREEGPRREKPEGKKKRGMETRTVVSGADDQDVAAGTREKLMQAFREARSLYNPSFALFSAGPCGAMIGTDLGEIAEAAGLESGLPTAAVELTGQKAYDVGVSKTTEVLAKLLAKDAEPAAGAVNILGANGLDWAAGDIGGVRSWITGLGYQVLAQPGGTVTAAELETLGRARLNLAVSVSGLAAARYLQSRFETPYLAAAPFGADRCKELQLALEGRGLPQLPEAAQAEALIIGEQLTANAVRAALEQTGVVQAADVATFYLLDKACARAGDLRLRGEDAAREVLNRPQYRYVIADPLLRPLLQRDCRWIDLPHKALNLYGEAAQVSLLGQNLDNWLDGQL